MTQACYGSSGEKKVKAILSLLQNFGQKLTLQKLILRSRFESEDRAIILTFLTRNSRKALVKMIYWIKVTSYLGFEFCELHIF